MIVNYHDTLLHRQRLFFLFILLDYSADEAFKQLEKEAEVKVAFYMIQKQFILAGYVQRWHAELRESHLQAESELQRATMDATRITRQLEETIDEFERQKIRDIKVCSAVHYFTGSLGDMWNIKSLSFLGGF